MRFARDFGLPWAMTAIGMVLMAVVGTALVGMYFPAEARGTHDGIVTNVHRVIVSSTAPTCHNEDPGPNDGPRPCTWNIGSQYTPADGLQYFFDTNNVVHYVWNVSPLLNHPEREWHPSLTWCWVKTSTGVGKCPNGDTAAIMTGRTSMQN